MATLVVTIKTQEEEFKSFDQQTKDSILRWSKPDEIKYSPLTARIIEISLYDIERKQGVTYKTENIEDKNGTDVWLVKKGTEKEILEDFWEGAKSYDIFVTYNGRSFTLPFLIHRSIANKVKPTVDIAKQRYVTKQSLPYHVDLIDEFSFLGAMRRPSLHMLCQLYVIEEYNEASSVASLFEIWKEYLAPASFINAVEF